MSHSNDYNEDSLLEGVIAREIVQEIMKYGVSQEQIKKVIRLLALELESNVLMKKLCKTLEENEESPRQDLIT